MFRFLFFVLFAVFVLPELYFRLIHRSNWKEYEGSWAVVTGSSYGIGRDVAFELASRGLHVVVHGRSKDKLESLCSELKNMHGVQCRVIVQDVVSDPKWQTIPDQIKDLDISVLVNNVGGGSPDGVLSRFGDVSLDNHKKLLDFNLGSTLSWTHMVLPSMTRRGAGRIIMCSSLAYLACLNTSAYGPSKNAIHGLTYLINNDYDQIVRSETWLIGPVSTPALANAPADEWFVVSSPAFAKRGIQLFGFYEEYAPALGHAIQKLQHFFLKLLHPHIRSMSVAQASKPVYDAVRSRIDKKEL